MSLLTMFFYFFYGFCLLLFYPLIFANENTLPIPQDILEIIEQIDSSADAYLQSGHKTYDSNQRLPVNLNFKIKDPALTQPSIPKKSYKPVQKKSPSFFSKKIKTTQTNQATQTNKTSSHFGEINYIKFLMDEWISAWSEGNADAYIKLYTADYSPKNKTREGWISNRKNTIKANKNIKVKISDIDFKIIQNKQIIRCRFKQKYSSFNYKDLSRKELLWKKVKGKWLISSERVIK